MTNPNHRTILALRELADRLEAAKLPATGSINHALSVVDGDDDADRLYALLNKGATERTR